MMRVCVRNFFLGDGDSCIGWAGLDITLGVFQYQGYFVIQPGTFAVRDTP